MTGIYYADLFEINGYGCVIMGHGKTKVCRYYIKNKTEEIAADSIRFNIENSQLWAYADIGMGIFPFNAETSKHIEVKYLIYMDDENENHCDYIKEISKDEFCNKANFNITYAASDMTAREEEFKLLIKDVDIKCIEVPWCDTVEIRGSLIRNYIA